MNWGIDFGTCFSLGAVQVAAANLGEVRNEGAVVPLIRYGKYGIPSVFYHDPVKGPRAGDTALYDGRLSKDLIREIKLDLCSQRVVNGHTYTARQIAGRILKEVKKIAQEQMDKGLSLMTAEPLESVVITIPAKFEHNERAALMDAARIPDAEGGPDLNVLGLIKEPVAAALYYFSQPLVEQTRVLVYDLGGGTCDIAIVEADSSRRGKYTVIDADTVLDSERMRIGCRNWDSRLEKYIVKKLQERGITLSDTIRLDIMEEAVKAKEALSYLAEDDEVYKIRIASVPGGPDDKNVYITRSMFDKMTKDLLDETIRWTEKLLSRHPNHRPTKLLCVGGGSNMPQVQKALNNAFGEMVVEVREPELAVVRGAAIYANQAEVSDIASYSYGIRALDRRANHDDVAIFNLIKQNERLSASEKYTFYTSKDNQDVISVPVYESSITHDIYRFKRGLHHPIMEVELLLPPNTRKDTPLYTTMTLTMDGILEVTADDHNGHVINGIIELSSHTPDIKALSSYTHNPKERDFFISYNNRQDTDRAQEIANTLREAGYSVWFQKDDSKNGMSIPKYMAEGIGHSKGFIAVWSDAYEKSDFCMDEANAAYMRHKKDKSYRLFLMKVSGASIENALFSQFVHTTLLFNNTAMNRVALLKAVKG